MPAQTNVNLQGYLAQGLSGVSELWSYKTKNWVTCVCAGDIDQDGEIEIVAGSRDGRVRVLTKQGDIRWERIIGNKDWVGAVAIIPQARSIAGHPSPIRIIVGTRDGLVYALDKDGRTIGKDGKRYAFTKEGWALEPQEEKGAFWFRSDHVIRQLFVSPERPTDILIASEDRNVYLLDLKSGDIRWQFATNGWIRALFACDLNGDGEIETIVGSKDKHIYLLDKDGHYLAKRRMDHAIYTLTAADIDDDGHIEILVGTDGKELVALSASLEIKWSQPFKNRLLSLHAKSLDGLCKLIVGAEDRHIYFLDKRGKKIWRHYIGSRVFSVSSSDINNDGHIEVLAGSEDKVHAFRVHLVKDLSGKIRRNYQKMGMPPPSTLISLSINERILLQDLLDEEIKEHETLKQVTLKHVEHLIENQDYLHALLDLLRLQHQKVQVLWRKNDYGHIRSLCFGDISGDFRREIILGTSEGTIHAFTNSGRTLWTLTLGEEILSVQTGYIDRSRWEEIIVCSSDHRIYIISGANGTKSLGRQEGQVKRAPSMNKWMTCFHVLAESKQGPIEVLVGSEDKQIRIYDHDLITPSHIIDTPQGIKTIYAYMHTDEGHPQIVAGSLKNTVYAYTRNGTLLWEYMTKDRVLAVCVKDIDSDDQLEIVIGSEDCNVHVLDSKGHLKWRYYLRHSILAIDAIDIDGNGKAEILIGCADGNLYVLNHDGEFLWKYHTTDRIRAIKAEDIDDDGHIEIALGTEDQLEVLQVVNQQQVHQLIDCCWQNLQNGHDEMKAIDILLDHHEPLIRAFALQKLAEHPHSSANIFAILEAYSKDNAIIVRKTLVSVIMLCYPINPQKAQQLLAQLSIDPEVDVRQAIIEQISHLVAHDWEVGFAYLEAFSQNMAREMRYNVLRQLDHLIENANTPYNTPYNEAILGILLDTAPYTDSEWICQEAARCLAHFFDRYPDDLLVNFFKCIAKNIDIPTLKHIQYNARATPTQSIFSAFVPLLGDLDDTNTLERIMYATSILEEVKFIKYGEEIWLMYGEFCRLFRIRTLNEIADYSYQLDSNKFTEGNPYAVLIPRICQRLSIITRPLRLYLKREELNDRLAILLEAHSTIENILKFVKQEYVTAFPDSSAERLPDYHFFDLLLKRWQDIIFTRLRELRGRAELQVELKTRSVPQEEQIGIWLSINNTGRSVANNVKISLLHNNEFDVVGKNSFEADVIFSQETVHAEFCIRPHTRSDILGLNFEIAYDDAENVMKTVTKCEKLELQSVHHEFVKIPNHYSTGTPTHNDNMFFGREDDVEFLKDNLTRIEAKTVIVLYGQRRSGKTSLLLHLLHTPILGQHIPILIDMQKESYKIRLNTFFHNIAFYIFKELRKRGITVNQPVMETFERNATFAFDVFLEEVEEQIADKKIILLIDEFEVIEAQVKKGTLEPEFFEYLRSLMQHHRNINFLFSGTHRIEELTRDYWSVFFNIALHRQLSRLTPESAFGLITNPVKGYLQYEPYAVLKIRDLTADQPYLIHLICRSVVDHCNEKHKTYATINDVNTVLREVMQTSQVHFDWLWKGITPEERIVLAVLAEEGKEDGRALSQLELEEPYRHYHISYTRDQMTASLKELVAADIIEKVANDPHEHTVDNSRFRISVGLIRLWLLKEKPLELVLQETKTLS